MPSATGLVERILAISSPPQTSIKNRAADCLPPGWRGESFRDYSQIISATVLPAGMNGSTCSVYGTMTSST